MSKAKALKLAKAMARSNEENKSTIALDSTVIVSQFMDSFISKLNKIVKEKITLIILM